MGFLGLSPEPTDPLYRPLLQYLLTQEEEPPTTDGGPRRLLSLRLVALRTCHNATGAEYARNTRAGEEYAHKRPTNQPFLFAVCSCACLLDPPSLPCCCWSSCVAVLPPSSCCPARRRRRPSRPTSTISQGRAAAIHPFIHSSLHIHPPTLGPTPIHLTHPGVR